MSFKFLDNKTSGIIGDTLKEELGKGTKLSVISAYFTIHAYNQLKDELKKVDNVRLLFSEPTFVKNKKLWLSKKELYFKQFVNKVKNVYLEKLLMVKWFWIMQD